MDGEPAVSRIIFLAAARVNAPFGRAGTPEDAARLILFLASAQAQWITGQILHSRGGMWRNAFSFSRGVRFVILGIGRIGG